MSASATSGISCMNCSRTGTRKMCVTLCFSMPLAISVGSGSRAITPARPLYTDETVRTLPATWYIGMAIIRTDDSSISHTSLVTVRAGEEVVVRQHDALGASRGARRVELDEHVRRGGLVLRPGLLRGVDPGRVVLVLGVPAVDDDGEVGVLQLVGDGVQDGNELGPDDEDLRLRVVDDVGDLVRREPVVHRNLRGAYARRGEQLLRVFERVLVEYGHPVAVTDARGLQRRCDPVDAAVEVAEADLGVARDVRD